MKISFFLLDGKQLCFILMFPIIFLQLDSALCWNLLPWFLAIYEFPFGLCLQHDRHSVLGQDISWFDGCDFGELNTLMTEKEDACIIHQLCFHAWHIHDWTTFLDSTKSMMVLETRFLCCFKTYVLFLLA
jgi:hypothetical protein